MINISFVERNNKTHDGVSLGLALGFIEGDSLGLAEGFAEGESLGVALGSDEGNELGLWVARTTASIDNVSVSRVSFLVSNSPRSCAGSTDSPVLTISTTTFITVVAKESKFPSISSELTGDISLLVKN